MAGNDKTWLNMAINVQTKTKRSGKKGKRIPKKNRYLYNKYVQSQVAHISYNMPWIHLSSTRLVWSGGTRQQSLVSIWNF